MNLRRLNTKPRHLLPVSPIDAEILPKPSPGATFAYQVPWRVIARDSNRSVMIRNDSDERLTFVRFAIAGSGELAVSLPRHVQPGESLVAELVWPYASADTLITVRWFRPDQQEYLWVLSL